MMNRFLSLLLLLAIVQAGAAQQSATPTNKTATDDGLRRVVVTVKDSNGSLITDLDSSAFAIVDEKLPQQIIDFRQDEPFDCALLFDMSRSVGGHVEELNAFANGVIRFAGQNNKANNYFVMGFGEPTLTRDWTSDTAELLAGLQNLQKIPNDRGHLFDTVYEALTKMASGSNKKKVMLLITDGEDSGSRRTINHVRDLMKRTDCSIYFFVLGQPEAFGSKLPTLEMPARKPSELVDLAKLSGGSSFSVDKPSGVFPHSADIAQLDKFLNELTFELRHQYTLGYRAPQDLRGKSREIKVTVKLPATAKTKIGSVSYRKQYLSTPS
jgi:Ca-activated chloride channel family protein